jgi:hypothetical protein
MKVFLRKTAQLNAESRANKGNDVKKKRQGK